MTTYSQLVDELVTEFVRPDLRVSITSYVNQTIRELHADSKAQTPILFDANRMEYEGMVSSLPAQWMIPHVTRFQRLETVYYPDYGVYAKQRHPSRAYEQRDNLTRFYWYRSGPVIILSGLEENNEFKLTYFEFPRHLIYYAPDARPAIWDYEAEVFEFNPEYIGTPELQELAIELTSNWLLLRWLECIKQGTRAKIWARVGEADRGRVAYSLYEQERQQLVLSESLEQNPDGS